MKHLWLAFTAVVVFSFSILGWVGTRIYQEAPPLPDQVVATDGKVVIPSGDIGKGQNVWQAMGGMEAAVGFWAMNIGLLATCVLSLLPVGLMQTWASVDKGYWYARSPEFLHTEIMQTLRWLRVPGDTFFALGAIALVWFVAGLKTGHSLKSGTNADSQPSESKPLS